MPVVVEGAPHGTPPCAAPLGDMLGPVVGEHRFDVGLVHYASMSSSLNQDATYPMRSNTSSFRSSHMCLLLRREELQCEQRLLGDNPVT